MLFFSEIVLWLIYILLAGLELRVLGPKALDHRGDHHSHVQYARVFLFQESKKPAMQGSATYKMVKTPDKGTQPVYRELRES